ncbi:MAG: polysaccharide biosynthesis C-terminal domain-containing protein [Magnetococcus sp. DMHC-6]
MSLNTRPLVAILWGQMGMGGRTALTFVISILVARALGADSFGVYVSLIAVVELLIKITDMGVYTTFSTYIPRLRHENLLGQCSYLTRQILTRRFILLLATVCILILLQRHTSWLIFFIHERYLSCLLLLFLVRATMDGFIFIVIAQVDMRYYSAVEIGVSLVQLAGVLWLIESGLTVEAMLWLMVVVHALQCIFYAYRSWGVLQPTPDPFPMASVWRFGCWVWLGTLFYYLRQKSIDILLLLFLIKDKRAIAHYEIAYMLVMYGGLVLLSSLERLGVSLYASALARDGMAGLGRIWQWMTKLSILLAIPVLVFLWIHADHLIHAFYTPDYLAAVPLLWLFAGLQIGVILLAGETTDALLFPMGKEKLFLYLNALQGFLNLFLGILLIPYFGAMGAVLATGGTAFLAAILNLHLITRPLHTPLPWRFSLSFFLLTLLLAAPTRLYPNPNLFVLIGLALLYGLSLLLLAPRVVPVTLEERLLLEKYLPKWWWERWLPKRK